MNLSQFLLCLMVATVMTGLITQAIKMLMEEWGKEYRANTLAGIVAIFTGAAIGAMYVVILGVPLDSRLWVCLIALVLLSWLCAMVGYDKVLQAIEQFKHYGAGAGIAQGGGSSLQGSVPETESRGDDSGGGSDEDELPGVTGEPDPEPTPEPAPEPEPDSEPKQEPGPGPVTEQDQEAESETATETETEQE